MRRSFPVFVLTLLAIAAFSCKSTDDSSVKSAGGLRGQASFQISPGLSYGPETLATWVNAEPGCKSQDNICVYLPFTALQASSTNSELIDLLRIGLAQAVNNTCFGPEKLVHLKDISQGNGLAFLIDGRACYGDKAATKIGHIIKAELRLVFGTQGEFPAASPVAPLKSVSGAYESTAFVYNALHGSVYYKIMEWPSFDADHIKKYNIQPDMMFVSRKERNAIVMGPRIMYGLKYTAPNGKQYVQLRSADEFYGRNDGALPPEYQQAAPSKANYMASTYIVGSSLAEYDNMAAEVLSQMPNGLFASFVFGGQHQLRAIGDSRFAIDPYNPNHNLESGFGCLVCHSAGPRGAYDPPSGKGWTDEATLQKIYGELRAPFDRATTEIIERDSAASPELATKVMAGTEPAILYSLRYHQYRVLNYYPGPNPKGYFSISDCAGWAKGKFKDLCAVGWQKGVVQGFSDLPANARDQPYGIGAVDVPDVTKKSSAGLRLVDFDEFVTVRNDTNKGPAPERPQFQQVKGYSSYARDVLPRLKHFECLACHPAWKKDLSSFAAQIDRALARIEGHTMPLTAPYLSSEDVEVLRRWKADGFRP